MTIARRAIGLAILVGAAILTAGAGAAHEPAELLSTGPAGGNGPITAAYAGSSQDGGVVYFETLERLTSNDTDNRNDVYERADGITTLVSTGATGGNGGIDAFFYGTSADGAVVVFGTAERLTAADTDSASDVYARTGGTTSLVSAGTTGGNGPQSAFFDGISADGSAVFFHTTERLVSGDTDSVQDVYGRTGGTTTLLSTGTSGGNGAFPAFFDGSSADGARVIFDTDERLEVGDTDSVQDLYERTGSSTSLLSTGPDGGNAASPAFFDAVSRDGTRVTFSTDEILTEPDADTSFDVYQRDGGVLRVMSATADIGNDAFDALYAGSSPDGSHVFFETAERLGGGDNDNQVDVFERSGPAITRRSAGNGAFDALFAGAASDGSHVLYETEEQVLAADTDADVDVYDGAGTTELISTGPAGGNGAFDAFLADVSDDGGRAFFTTAESLVAGDTDAGVDVYERSAGSTSVVSVGTTGGNGAFNASFAAASTDGTSVVFTTTEALAAGDTDATGDIYAARLRTGYPRPKAATPVRVSLVPAYEECTAPDRVHGPPLAFGSCSSPVQSSAALTVGTPDANGQPARSTGWLRLGAVTGNPATPGDQADVVVTMSLTDVRLKAGLADYAGEVTATVSARVTDRDGPATVSDFPFDIPAQCTPTATDEGSNCTASTTFDALVPGAITEGQRAIWQLGAVEVSDGSGGTLARQGVFVP